MSRVNVVVSTTGERPLDDVKRELIEAGLHEPRVLETIGLILGSIESENIPRASTVAAVDSIEFESSVDIGPPGRTDVW